MKPLKMGMIKAIIDCNNYKKMIPKERTSLQHDRLSQLVNWAKENSPYYSKLYQNIGEHFSLSDLPPVNKKELMAHWNEWVTDSNITLDMVNQFMNDLDHIGRKINHKYLVFTTSGSTGNPLVTIADSVTNNVMGGINTIRSFTRKEDMRAFIKRGGKTIGVFATGGFYLSNVSVRSRLLAMPWKKKQIAVTSALLPISQIVKELNEFQPAMLGGYPSNLELLIDEQQSGRLHISPVIIMTGGEYLSDTLRKRLSETFHCYVQTTYSCTEGGTIACECKMQHFHINDDWLIVEAVDKDNQPVPDGVLADKILLTNLYNYTQPFIRYELTDRIVMHHEPCACGNPSPYLTIEGRTDDVVCFTENGKKVRLAPLAIYATLKEVHALRKFQMIAHPDNKAELLIEPMENYDIQTAFQFASDALSDFFKLHGLSNITITLSADKPKQDPKSGKYKHIIQR